MLEDKISDEIDIRHYIRVIRKHKLLLLLLFFIIVITTTIYSVTAIPIYEAFARIIIEKDNPNVVSFQEVMKIDATGMDYYQTQYKIIESRTIIKEVIKRLNIDKNEEFFPKKQDNFFSNIKNSLKEVIKTLKDTVLPFIAKKEQFKTDDKKDKESALITQFQKRITIAPIRNSRLVDLKFEAKNPVLASEAVNTLAQAYIDQSLDIKLQAVQDAVKWLHERIESERSKVEKAERALLEYKEKNNIITDFSSDTEQVTAQKLAQLNTQVIQAESQRVEAETRYKQAAALQGRPDMVDSISLVMQNELVREIKKMEVELYKRTSEFSKKYGVNHPQMLAIQSELKTLQTRKNHEINRIIDSLKNEYNISLAKEASLKQSLNTQKQDTLDLNEKAIQYIVLRRESESARAMYDLLIKRFKETTMTEDMKTGNIRIIDKAEIPKEPIRPRVKQYILISILVGLFVGIGFTFLVEYLDNTVRLPDDIKEYLKVPFLGPVPYLDIIDDRKDEIPELVTLHSPKSTASESYRGIRTNILLSSADKEPKTILISSAGPQEGKTLTTTNIAVTMAQSGNKVIILDCDLRRPKVHKLFKIPRDVGMTNILVGSKDYHETIINIEGIPNLCVIPSGPIPPNPSEILSSNKMKELLEDLKNNFDKIIIDTPPLTAVTDAVILSKIVDGCVIVIRANDTIKDVAKNGIEQIRTVGGHILGAVLNGINIGKEHYYYYQYYYYYYGEDGDKKRKDRVKKKVKDRYSEGEKV